MAITDKEDQMGRLVVLENISLDGVMQAPGRPDEDTRGDFQHGGWAAQALEKDPEAVQASMAGQEQSGAMLFGRRTYEDVVGHWLSTPEPNPFTEILEKTPKYVASRTLTEPLPHPNSTLLKGDAIHEISALRQQSDKDLVVLGSGVLVRDLAAAGLIDEYVLTIIPVVLGSGARLFGDTYIPLQVANSITTSSGIVVATLRVEQ